MSGGGALPEDVKRAEDYLKRRMGMRMTANTKQLTDEATAQVLSILLLLASLPFFIRKAMCVIGPHTLFPST